MQADVQTDFRLTPEERVAYDRDGFLLRESVFEPAELGRIAADCEALATRIEAVAAGEKEVMGAYMFQRMEDLLVTVKWEPDAPEVLQGLESLSHLSPELRDWGLDPRLVDPCRALVGDEAPILWTEKLNLKRAAKGGKYTLHQDFPYWRKINPVADRVITAMVFLDDASVENGCLEVGPGSHQAGMLPRRQVDGFGSAEMDPDQFDHGRLKPLEARAGSVVFFGPFLVHRSLPNRSAQDRRALLYSYQPAGHPHLSELRARARSARET